MEGGPSASALSTLRWTQAKQAKVTPPGRAPMTTTSRLPDLAGGQTRARQSEPAHVDSMDAGN